jgi:hypothetical protein
LLQAAAQQDHRVSLFVVHHSGVCGLLAGALATAFEVLPRDLAPFHALAAARRREQARPQEQARSNDGNGRDGRDGDGSALAGLHGAFAGFAERWALCDGVLRAAWTPRAADAWALQTRPQRARSRAGSFGRRGSSLETLVVANRLGRGHDEASVYAGAPRPLYLSLSLSLQLPDLGSLLSPLASHAVAVAARMLHFFKKYSFCLGIAEKA